MNSMRPRYQSNNPILLTLDSFASFSDIFQFRSLDQCNHDYSMRELGCLSRSRWQSRESGLDSSSCRCFDEGADSKWDNCTYNFILVNENSVTSHALSSATLPLFWREVVRDAKGNETWERLQGHAQYLPWRGECDDWPLHRYDDTLWLIFSCCRFPLMQSAWRYMRMA